MCNYFYLPFPLQLLHREIENHGKIVNSVIKLCKRTEPGCKSLNAVEEGDKLKKRWLLLFLKSLEWQLYIESIGKLQSNKVLQFIPKKNIN